jgi:hypothetical protein
MILEKKDAYAFNLIKRYIKYIIFSQRENECAFIGKSIFISEKSSYLNWPNEALCGFLVRKAVQSRICNGFKIYRMGVLDRECKLLSFNSEYHSQKKIWDDFDYFNWLDSVVKCLRSK